MMSIPPPVCPKLASVPNTHQAPMKTASAPQAKSVMTG